MPDWLEVGMPEYTGGEGQIFFSKDGQYAIKIYHKQKGGLIKRQLLDKIWVLGTYLTEDEAKFLCWPLGLVDNVDGNECVGCVTRRIPTPPYTMLVDIMLTPKEAKEQFLGGKSWADYLQIARGIARSIAVLSGKGCAHADLHFRNFLVDPVSTDVVLIDLDGLVVPDFLPPQVSGMYGFMAPEVVMGRTVPDEHSDRHSLAVLVLYTLLFRNVLEPLRCYDPNSRENDDQIGWGSEAVFSEHPRDHRNRPRMLGVPLFQEGALSYHILTPALQKLTERALVEGLHNPDKRPSAQQWINNLSWALDELWQCSNCRQYFPYPHWVIPVPRRACPFCGQRRLLTPFPSILSLYEPRSRGNYVFTQRYLVLGDGWKLFPDVLESQHPPMSRKGEKPVGHVEWDDKSKTNYLVNEEDVSWRARLSRDASDIIVSKGTSVPLQSGNTIYFGEGRRLLIVRE
jgi:DNA-binding helix-hairpin-helix protein with protein kinase domain